MSAILSCLQSPRRTEVPPETRNDPSILPWDPLAVTVHDIRTPLSVIAMAADLLQASVEQEGAPEDLVLLQTIRHNTSCLALLVDNLSADLELSASFRPMDLSIVDLWECLEASVAPIQAILEQRDQKLRWPAEGVATVCGDRRQIGRVLTNLLINASRFGDPHREIQISFERRDEWTWVQIHNDGPSIPRLEQEHIFERLVRGSNGHSTDTPGIGLGLHIVKTIVERHGGQVGVVSSPDKGTLFWLTLPSVDPL